ncbi:MULTISPECIES: ketopantoate reductase family protein [Microbacterium]|uniref:ketopantoate reductase family protein n=1 Tax=Microbacterium TaxID=33882 RepID=UPI0010F6595B|nr:2-dehydropantoate 2-reductase [Microbacterium sp. 4NA327F11]MCK9916733.1 2-dehydropantoate 2-reductase [Microbacteriaceae bacterium K1510]
MTRIAILGSGANGASIGADLLLSGHDVTLVEQWPAHVEAMRADGLTIETPHRTVHVDPPVLHLCELAEQRHPFDVVLMLVKAYDSRWAAQLIRPHLRPTSLVAGVQNGMSTAAIADVVGADRTMGTVIEVSSAMTEPGRVTRYSDTDQSWFAVGALPRSAASGREEEVAALLREAGRVEVVEDILSTKWMKLISNATVLVPTAILGLPMADAVLVEGMREVMLAAGEEARLVGAAAGRDILPIFGLSADALRRPDAVVSTLLDTLYTGFVRPGATTTVLQDWTKGRHSEVDDINGTVVAEGARVGVATPVNARIVAVAHEIEQGVREAHPDNLALLRIA